MSAAPCAQDANAAERGLPSGAELQQSGQRTYSQVEQEQLAQWTKIIRETVVKPLVAEFGQTVGQLLTAMLNQTEAINRLAASNEGLIQAMAEADGDEPEQPRRYMDGSPAR